MATAALVEEVVEEVAGNLEEAAELTRRIDVRGVGFFLGGLGLGLAVGFYFGHRWNRQKIYAEAFEQSEEEVAKIREVYQQKTVAAQPKPSVEEVLEEKGYSQVVVEERPLKPPVPIISTPVSAPPVVTYEGGKSKDEHWDYAWEIAQRSPEFPYVIHQDEFNEEPPGYHHVTYTYYADDDVLVDEDDTPLAHADMIVGQANLRFGHGTDDIDVVFVRNDKMELEMEICRIPKSYQQEVLGINLEHSDTHRKRRNRFDSDDEN